MKTMKIYGPPGTGKTTTLISTLGKLLERGYRPSEIAYLSHTRAAAVEARDRIAQQYDGYSLRDDFKWFRTIHSACCAVLGIGGNTIMSKTDLKQFSKETGFVVKGSMDLEMALDATDGERTHDIILNARSKALHRKVPIEQILQELPDDPALASTGRFLEAYDKFKQQLGKVDFDDMLDMIDCHSLPCKVVLVDECQDLSDRQWDIVHSFAKDAEFLYLAGDDDQAIYEFMGSSNGGFLKHEFDKEVVLDHSYRCCKAIGDAAQDIVLRVKERHEKAITWREDEGVVQRTGMSIEDLPWKDYAAQGDSVMVLFRHQKQCYKLGYALQDMDIPYTMGGTGITMSDKALCIKTYLSMRHNKARCSSFEVNRMFRAAGDTAAANAVNKGDPHADYGMEDCPSKVWAVKNWPKMFAKWESERKNLERLRRLVNIYGVSIIGDEPSIDISTYHASKGREADIVVLNTDCYKRTWDEQQRNPDVETRLCYVGITRARNKALILAPRTDMYMRALVEN